MNDQNPIETARLCLRRLNDDDASAIGELLGDPHVAIAIMCDSSTPEKCRKAARRRIDWFNSYWDTGYGVRAVTIKDPALGTPGDVIGWAGVAGYSGSEGEPEILYGLKRHYWGKGLAREAGHAAIADFFARTSEQSLCAIIFEQLNASSVRVAERLGLSRRRRVAFADFSPGEELRQQTLDYALWCYGSPAAQDDAELRISAAAKAGLLVGSGIGDAEEIRSRIYREAYGSAVAEKAASAFDSAFADPTCPYLSLSREALAAA